MTATVDTSFRVELWRFADGTRKQVTVGLDWITAGIVARRLFNANHDALLRVTIVGEQSNHVHLSIDPAPPGATGVVEGG